MVNVSIIGATGYTGLELMNLLSVHSNVNLSHVCARSQAGQSVTAIYPALIRYKDIIIEDIDIDNISKDTDIAFVALPHAASAEIAGRLFEKGVRVIDLSADFRYRDLALYEQTYNVKHPCPGLLKQAVYGLPEINRAAIKTAGIVGNPGCYTTSAILPLYPLLKENVISAKGIIVDSASGVSGAGKKADADYSFTELSDNYKAYGVTTHRHTSEIEEVLSLNTGHSVSLDFTPHLLPVKRGILSTIYADLNTGINANAITDIYNKYYKNEPFVIVSEILPEIKHIVYSNYIRIAFKHNAKSGKLIIISALDNLTKGASGQAVQNMNIMSGLPEDAGLIAPAKLI